MASRVSWSLSDLFQGLDNRGDCFLDSSNLPRLPNDIISLEYLINNFIQEDVKLKGNDDPSLFKKRQLIGIMVGIAAELYARDHPQDWYILEDHLSNIGLLNYRLDFVGMYASGTKENPTRIKAKNLGDYSGFRAKHIIIEADEMGDSTLRESLFCKGKAIKAGQEAGKSSIMIHLEVEEAGNSFLKDAKGIPIGVSGLAMGIANFLGPYAGENGEYLLLVSTNSGNGVLRHASHCFGSFGIVGDFAGAGSIDTALHITRSFGKELLSCSSGSYAIVPYKREDMATNANNTNIFLW